MVSEGSSAGPGATGSALKPELADLRDELVSRMASGAAGLRTEEAFTSLALRVFRAQCRWNAVYGAFVRGRGIDPETLDDWRRIPAVPTGAFRSLPLVTGGDSPEGVIFRTSGTTAGTGSRGEHRVSDPGLYRAALLPPFRDYLLPDGARLPLLSLIPPPWELRDSSLSFMMGVVAEVLCPPGGGWFVDALGEMDGEGMAGALQAAEAAGDPVLLAGTAFAWVHWLDAMDRRGLEVRLPEGSRILETGGFKGRSRTLSREELYGALESRLGIPAFRIVNEYGMTELLTQFYEPVLVEGGPGDPRDRRHVGPPWIRTRILDPETLDEVSPGEPGLLCHLDLANLFSVSAVLTEDLGVAVADGFRVLGRAPGAEPRGCSRAMDELLSGAAEP